MRTERWRRGETGRSPLGLGRSLALVAGAIALVAVAVYGLLHSARATDERQVAEDEAAQIELLQVRVELAWLHHDLLTDALGGRLSGTPIEPLFTEFGEERDRLLGEVRRLARLDGNVGPLAESLLEIHDRPEVGRWPIDASLLDVLHYDSMPFTGAAGPVADRLDAHLDAVSVTMLPRLVLGDALALATARRDERPPRWAVEYVEHTASVATDDPGWMGPARQSPVTNHVIGGPGAPDGVYRNVRAMADAVESVEPALQRTWDYDRWIIAGDLDSGAPLTIDELAAQVDEINAAFEAGFLAGMAEERAAVLDAAASESTATLWLVGAIAALAALSVGACAIIVRQWRRQRSLTEAAYVDGLTGAFNRRFLSEEVDGWCHRRVGHVAIAMVDLDRFKLVNDTWGHAAGDAVLTETAQRLAIAAARVGQTDADAASAVVRIGGDEFLLVWAGHRPFDIDAIADAIADVSGPVDTGAGESVPLELSVGVATAATPALLDDLMRAADLAAYADKSAKRANGAQPLADQHPLPERA